MMSRTRARELTAMRLKLYRAPAMAQAMARVRAELGEDALILATRRVGDGVEVTAALEPDDAAATAAPPPDPARLAALDFHGVPAALHAALQQGELEAALAKALPFGTHCRFGEAPLLLVGPPGAGKTLTVARLATRLVMAGILPMVITADGKRAGATEQLAAFTRLLGISLIVASHPVTLGRALTRRQNSAPVLIDTPGLRSVRPRPGGGTDGARRDRRRRHGAGAASRPRPRRGRRPGARLCRLPAPACWWRRGSTWRAASAASWPPPARGLALTEAGIGPGAADGLLPITPAWLAARLLTGTPHMTDGRTIAIASGKGGVGKTWFAITLAHALARQGGRVLLFDADLGLANVDIQLGLTPRQDLGGVIAGRATLADATLHHPDGGFDIIAGRSGSGALSAHRPGGAGTRCSPRCAARPRATTRCCSTSAPASTARCAGCRPGPTRCWCWPPTSPPA